MYNLDYLKQQPFKAAANSPKDPKKLFTTVKVKRQMLNVRLSVLKGIYIF